MISRPDRISANRFSPEIKSYSMHFDCISITTSQELNLWNWTNYLILHLWFDNGNERVHDMSSMRFIVNFYIVSNVKLYLFPSKVTVWQMNHYSDRYFISLFVKIFEREKNAIDQIRSRRKTLVWSWHSTIVQCQHFIGASIIEFDENVWIENSSGNQRKLHINLEWINTLFTRYVMTREFECLLLKFVPKLFAQRWIYKL